MFINQNSLFQNATITSEFDSKVQNRELIYFLTAFALK
jgi:hypothetical protein